MYPLEVSMEGESFLVIKLNIMLGHIDQYPLLVYWIRVLGMGMKSVSWYHFYRYGFVFPYGGVHFWENWIYVLV